MYVVARDYGFAPNPFHGYCTLATCKPGIRNVAQVGDWVIGMGGARLKATEHCIFAMRVTEKLTFNEYWENSRFLDKKPVRNGSRKMMVGDNIYYRDTDTNTWHQADSHHSYADGSTNLLNLARDTKSENVLISEHFFYFGKPAPCVPCDLLKALGFKNQRNHRTFREQNLIDPLINWLETTYDGKLNRIMGKPYDFAHSEKRYSGR